MDAKVFPVFGQIPRLDPFFDTSHGIRLQNIQGGRLFASNSKCYIGNIR
jgi:hypothetical protein